MLWVLFSIPEIANYMKYFVMSQKDPQTTKRLLNEIAQRSVFFLNQPKDFNLIMLRFLPSKQYNSFGFNYRIFSFALD